MRYDNYPWWKRKTIRGAVLAFVVVTFLFMTLIYTEEEQYHSLQQQRMEMVADEKVADFRGSIEKIISLAYLTEVFIEEREGKYDEFLSFAQKLYPLYAGVDTISILPHGKKSEIYPKLSEEERKSLFQDQLTQKWVKKALLTKKLIITDAIDLPSKYVGNRLFLPVYLDKNRANKKFWGFVEISIRYDNLLRQIEIDHLEERGYGYFLLEKVEDKEKLLAGEKIKDTNLVTREIKISGKTWYLGIFPLKNATAHTSLSLKIIFAILISLIFAFITKKTISLSFRRKHLTQMALKDTLTGISNRRKIIADLKNTYVEAQTRERFFATCYFDINHFKSINDTLGHDAGDEVLYQVATRIKKMLPKKDLFGRLGGDEFLFILKSVANKEEAIILIEKILKELDKPLLLQKGTLLVSISIGCAFFTKEIKSAEDILKNADTAMYEAKKIEGNTYIIYQEKS